MAEQAVTRNARPVGLRNSGSFALELSKGLSDAVTQYHLNRRFYTLSGKAVSSGAGV